MILCNIFSQFFLFVFLVFFIINCDGQEHHNDNPTNLVKSKDSESTVIVDPTIQHIETTNVHPINLEKQNILLSSHQQYNDNQHTSDTFQTRQEFFHQLNQLLEDKDDIENHFQYLSPPLPLQLSNDISSENRIKEDDQISVADKIETISPLLFNTNEDEYNSTTSKVNTESVNSISADADEILTRKNPKTYWRLPKSFEPTFELIENQITRFINLLSEFLQTTLFGHIDDHERLMNTIWFGSICTMCFLFSFIFLSLGTKRLKQSKHEKEIRARCQQLQQYNDQVEFEYATFKREHQKLLNEIDKMKNEFVRYEDDIVQLRKNCTQLHKDLKAKHTECDALQEDIDFKQGLIQKHEFDMRKQMEIVAYLNDEILEYQQESEKERETIARLKSNDLSLERFEKLQDIIHELKLEITQLKQDKFAQIDQLQQVQEYVNQLDIGNNELTIKMKQLKDLLEQRDQTIARIREKMLNDNEEERTEIGDLLSIVTDNNLDNDQQQRELLSTIDNDVEKANQHMRDLHSELEEKTRRIKDFDSLLNQEKDRCRELETKLKVVLELRERDAHLHIRQLGHTDSELRKARTDTERVRILQQQLELKQQQLDDVQKVLASEQMKSSDECSKLQHEIHEKWMEVKRLTRELDGARKECEGLRRQITKHGNSDRSSPGKTMHKPVAHHMNNTDRLSSEPETNGSSPPLPRSYQQGERSIDHSSDFSTTSSVHVSRTELRERDAHLHIRQLGHTDAELRKARTDTERVRILQQQLELKQQQLDDVQKVLASEQMKSSDECSKLQHEIHEKWMEVKRLTRELDGARKECEGLRRQITKHGNSDRSSQGKTMHKLVAHHMNNTDPVTTKYSESAVTIEPFTIPIETANVQRNAFQQYNEDEHLHDTIEARLQAKHNLRQSVHQHIGDDKHENEQDYINRLNSALENDYKTDHQFQYVAPPIEDTVNNTPLQNQTKEDVQVPLRIQNETTSSTSTSTSIQTPLEQQQQQTEEQLSSTAAPAIIIKSKNVPILDEKSNLKVISEEIIPPIEVQTNEQQPKDTIQQNVIKEDVLSIHEKIISKAQSDQQEEALNAPKPLTDRIPPSSNQQQPISKTTINDTLQNNNSLDVQPSNPTPLQSDQLQQPLSDPIQNISSVDLNLEQTKPSDTIQNNSSVYQNLSPPTPIKADQEQQIFNSTQNVNSSDQQQQQQIPETIQNISSIDHMTPSVQENQQPQVINTIKLSETVPIDVKSDDILSVPKESSTLVQTSPPPTRVLRSATSRIHQKPQAHHHHTHPQQQESEKIPTTDNTAIEATLLPIEQPIEEFNHLLESSLEFEEHKLSIESLSSLKPEEPHVETSQKPIIDLDINNETETQINDQDIKPIDTTDLPRQVHVHGHNTILDELEERTDINENLLLDEQIEDTATVDSFLVNDHSPHLPRVLENEETTPTLDSTIQTITNTPQTIENHTEINLNLIQNDSKTEETNNTLTSKSNSIPLNLTDQISPTKYRQVCWRLPKPLEPSFELTENQILRFINLLPEFLQTILFGGIEDRERLMNTIWFGSICTMCFLFSFIFLSLGAKRLKQSKHEKEIRARCQQLQQYNNQIELERATFERQNQKLSDEIDELKNLPVRDADEEIFELREKYEHLHAEWKIARTENDALRRDNDSKQILIQKHEFDMQKQVETVAYLNDEILRQKQELEKERETIARLKSNDLSLERFEKLQEIIHELKSEITQLKQNKFAQTDQLQQVQEHANQLDIDNNELTIKMKQLKDLLEQRDQTIARIREKMLNDDDEEKTTEIGDLLTAVTANNSSNDQQQQELLSNIDNDVEKANQHMRDLHSELEEKTRRIKDFDSLLNQEKDRCRELETKLKVVLELRERDAHLHIRQLGHTDSELRKARTDTERVRILQQQLELKQQQLDDVQKVLSSEQTKFSDECSKLQHEIHEKWMEVKRLTRELDGARKECEGLRRQITKYGNSDRQSQEKTMHKPVAHHVNNTDRLSSEPETNGSSPPLLYQQGDNFRPIDHERNDSGAASPAEMFRIRPPIFGLARPPFFPPPFMPPPPHNPFMMAPRFPMAVGGPHGLISPIPHLMTNGSGGSDANSFEIVDSANITPNSTSYDAQFNGSAVSPTPDNEQHATAKAKKPKKSLKKKTKTSATTTVSTTKEDV